MNGPKAKILWVLATCLLTLEVSSIENRCLAQENTINEQRPFVEHRVALQLSDSDPKKQAFILSMANKMLETYGPDAIDIQIVAIGPGIELVNANSRYRDRVDSLIAQGVTVNVCGYTLETIERETGKHPDINPKAVEVPAGGPFLLSLSERRYTIVRP
jgi:intracellular sulfur oxidation DsrE/DsrF family protein